MKKSIEIIKPILRGRDLKNVNGASFLLLWVFLLKNISEEKNLKKLTVYYIVMFLNMKMN